MRDNGQPRAAADYNLALSTKRDRSSKFKSRDDKSRRVRNVHYRTREVHVHIYIRDIARKYITHIHGRRRAQMRRIKMDRARLCGERDELMTGVISSLD